MTMRTRRIAIVCQPWDSVVARSGNSIVIIAQQLARRLGADWRITLYGRRLPGQKRWETDGGTIGLRRFTIIHKPHAILEILLGILACWTKTRIGYHLSYSYHLFYALRVAFSIRASKCDIVIVNNFPQFASIIKLLNPSAVVCLSMHCEWLSQYAMPANERRIRNLDLIIGCSEYITEAIRQSYPAISARCHTVYDGVDTNIFCPAGNSPQPNDGTEHLLYVGRLIPEKGIHVLIQAFKILVESRPTLRLDLVGTANTGRYLYFCADPKDRAISDLEGEFYGNRLFDMVRKQLNRRGRSYLDELDLLVTGDERIVFHGAVSHTETIDFYCKAAMLVFPSVDNEPSGLPTFESQACGTPVVSTYSGGIPEYVENGRTGLLVARGDAVALAGAISQLLDDPALARAMGEAGRQRVLERFTWDASARRFADLIEGVSLTVLQQDIGARGESPV